MNHRHFGKASQILILTVVALLNSTSSFAQYTDMSVINDLGGPQEFARRRLTLAQTLKTGYTLLFARNYQGEVSHYREDNDFFYFTGLGDPGAVLLMNNSDGSTTIFEPRQSPDETSLLGPNLLALSSEERFRFGYADLLPITDLDSVLSSTIGRKSGTDLWIRMSFPDTEMYGRDEMGADLGRQLSHPYHAPMAPEMAPSRLLPERYPMARIRDLTPAIDDMRNIKTAQEIAVLRRDGKLSAEGLRVAMSRAHPGMYEYEFEAEANYVFYKSGAQSVAYPAIVASGPNSVTPHYFSNRRRTQANDIVVFDFAASLDQETMDITRSFNVSGKFTPEQAKWYAVELEAQKAVIALLRPGHTYEEASAAGQDVFKRAGIKQWPVFFIDPGEGSPLFPGHFVGLATHDVFVPTGPIRTGQVVTVEPDMNVTDKHLYLRVEDTILVTDNGPEVLSSGVPKELVEVEKLVASQP
jgi:Xaa-Pro aminopeptidase